MNYSFSLLLLLLVGFPKDAEPQASPLIDAGSAMPYRISVDVNLVLLRASVYDRQHRFYPALVERDFAVYEDGVKQAIQVFRYEDAPVTVGLVVDHSGSMRPKMTEVIAAAQTLVRSSSLEDQMFVVNFNDAVKFGLPAESKLTNNADKLAAAISNTPTGGKTAFYDAMLKARDRLNEGSQDKKVLIVISDGGDNASTHSLVDVLTSVEQSGALVYAIGIFDQDDPDESPAVLRRLAHVTGGEAFFPRQLNEVVGICQRIAHDIRSQYTIGYVSSNVAAPGAYRTVRLVARDGGKRKLSVRTRAGYIAAVRSSPAKSEEAR